MINLSKTLCRAAFPLSLFFASTAFAQDSQISLNPLNSESPEITRTEFVDRHTVFLIDNSSSVDESEKTTMLRGIADVLLSGLDSEELLAVAENSEMLEEYLAGLDEEDVPVLNGYSSYAITFAFFGDEACRRDTYIIHSPEDAFSVISDVLWDPVHQTIPDICYTGTGTNMLPGLKEVQAAFDDETENGFQAVSRSVVVLGDERPVDHYAAENFIQTLSTDYGATIYGVPIEIGHNGNDRPSNLITYYNYSVATPAGLSFTDGYGGSYPVREGVSIPAENFTEVSPAVALALDLGSN